jgi:cullin-4
VDVLQQPKGRDVEDEDIFTFNDDFIAPLFRIKVHTQASGFW